MEAVEDIVIISAGIAGLAAALGLHRNGVKTWSWSRHRHCVPQDLYSGCGQMHGVHWMLSGSATKLESVISCLNGKVLIGGDGINSVVAKYLGLKKPSFSGRLATRGLAQYPTNHGYEPKFIQINGQGFRAGMITCTERSIYWFFGRSPSENGSEKADESIETMRDFVLNKLSNSNVPKEIIEVIQRSEMSPVVSSPLKYRSPFSLLFGNITKRNICVIGDAFHPMTPDLGQGGCIALKDSVILARCLSQSVYQGKIEEGLRQFAKMRKWMCAMVVAIAYIMGFIQQNGNWFVSILREVLSGIMAGALLKVPDYDCRKL